MMSWEPIMTEQELIKHRIASGSFVMTGIKRLITLAQKEYKTKYDCELCKRLKSTDDDKWSIYKQECDLENETRKILWDFKIQTNHSVVDRIPNFVLINKKKRNFIINYLKP